MSNLMATKIIIFCISFLMMWGTFNGLIATDSVNLDTEMENFENESVEELGSGLKPNVDRDFGIPVEINAVVVAVLGVALTISIYILLHPVK